MLLRVLLLLFFFLLAPTACGGTTKRHSLLTAQPSMQLDLFDASAGSGRTLVEQAQFDAGNPSIGVPVALAYPQR